MSTEDNASDDISEAEQELKRSASGAMKETPTATERFRDQVASKQDGTSDDVEAEEDLWSGGYSPKAMIGSWIATLVVSVAVVVGGVMASQWLIGIAIAVAVWIIVSLIYAKRRLGVSYQLTTQRFIHQVGILTRRTDRIEVIDIDDVSYTQGPIERALGVGSIKLTGSDRTHPELLMIGIDKVGDVAGLIDDIRRQERRKRSLHIEAI